MSRLAEHPSSRADPAAYDPPMLRPSRLPGSRLAFLVIVLLSLAALTVVAQSRRPGPDRVGWFDDLPAAQRAAAAKGRPVLLDFSATWCGPCQEMKRTTWADPAVAADIAARCVPVHVDVDAQPDVARRYGIPVLPTLVLTDASGRETRRIEGLLSADEFRQWLAGHDLPQAGG